MVHWKTWPMEHPWFPWRSLRSVESDMFHWEVEVVEQHKDMILNLFNTFGTKLFANGFAICPTVFITKRCCTQQLFPNPLRWYLYVSPFTNIHRKSLDEASSSFRTSVTSLPKNPWLSEQKYGLLERWHVCKNGICGDERKRRHLQDFTETKCLTLVLAFFYLKGWYPQKMSRWIRFLMVPWNPGN